MIGRLRIKFIAIMMAALVIVFAVVFVTLNLFMSRRSARQTYNLLAVVAEHDGFLAPPGDLPPLWEGGVPERFTPDPDMMRIGRFFYVKLSADGEVLEVNSERMFDYTAEEAAAYAQRVLQGGRARGTMDNLQYLAAEKDYGQIVAFAERSIETRMLAQLIDLSIWVAAGTFVFLFAFSVVLSKWAVRPVATAFAKQRRFISDASHELKTPLTIIGANVDVLENEIGPNTRLGSIREQAGRMGLLIHDLLTLARADEGGPRVQMQPFDWSRAVSNTVLEFESAAFEAGKVLTCDVEAGLRHTGDEQQIQKLLGILIDNAIKHSGDGGRIRVTLAHAGERLRLSVYNTGPGIAEAERERIFDRFYRSDDSRARETGGYGLGLAIAKAIVQAHGGRIAVQGKEAQWIEFVVMI